MIRLAGALLSEQNDEWLVQRRYLSVESMALILAEPERADHTQPAQRGLQSHRRLKQPAGQIPSCNPRVAPLARPKPFSGPRTPRPISLADRANETT